MATELMIDPAWICQQLEQATYFGQLWENVEAGRPTDPGLPTGNLCQNSYQRVAISNSFIGSD